MGHSSSRSRLYRKSARPVITAWLCTAMVCAVVGAAWTQIARRTPVNKGPRALGLLELAANGKAHLVPIAIMINGKFYDAASYKADPIPMALQRETVYEVLKTGVSQGLFSVTNATQSDPDKAQGRRWIADGRFKTTAQIEAEKSRAKAESERKGQKASPPETEIGGPPKLHRGASSGAPAPASTPPTQAQTPEPVPKGNPTPQKASAPPVVEDPNRPVLRRQAPSETTREQTKGEGNSEPLKGPLQFIPAISDEGGPSPRSYSYQMKPDEEAGYLKKMLAIAADEIKARAAAAKVKDSEPRPKSPKTPAKSARMPQFQDVQLRVFDLSNTNEPVLVLTANAKLPSANDLEYMVAVVARQDIYAELHKVFAETTDNQHLDVMAKYDLIDAVDADGDGRGELLFRMTSEAGSAFGVYRVIGDRLWPVFEGKPGG